MGGKFTLVYCKSDVLGTGLVKNDYQTTRFPAGSYPGSPVRHIAEGEASTSSLQYQPWEPAVEVGTEYSGPGGYSFVLGTVSGCSSTAVRSDPCWDRCAPAWDPAFSHAPALVLVQTQRRAQES